MTQTLAETVLKENFYTYSGKKIELKALSPSDLKEFEVDKNYMRQLNMSHVSDICKSFERYYKDFSFCQYTYPIAVSVRADGSKVIVDGQHRVYAASQTNKSIFAIFYYGLSVEEEMKLYFINNNIKMQSSNHRMDLMARLDKNVRRIYDIFDNHLIGWDCISPSISRLNFIAPISLEFSPTPTREIKKIPSLLELLDDAYYAYFNQILEIMNETYPYNPNFNVYKNRGKDLKAKNFWQRADLYQAVFRFIVIYHMRFGNTIKNSERISNFLSSIEDWESIYQKSRMKRDGGGRFYVILNELIEVYNKGRRNVEYMIPPSNYKVFDKNQFPYIKSYYHLNIVSQEDITKKEIKKEKNKIQNKLQGALQ
jgi:hypothetical protein